MKKLLFVLCAAVSFSAFANTQSKIPRNFEGLWVYAESGEAWKAICENPKILRNNYANDNEFAIFIHPSKKIMKLDGTWTSEISYFQTVYVNTDETQISGKERTKILWRDGISEEDENESNSAKENLRKYQLRIDGDKLYINEFLFSEDQPDFVFVRCKK